MDSSCVWIRSGLPAGPAERTILRGLRREVRRTEGRHWWRPVSLRVLLLLTGATGTVGLPLLRRLTAAGVPVRCLVRDPRRLGAQRVKVQIALGDLADPFSFRHALRGVDTVVHLAAAIRDQPAGSIEEVA